MPLPSKYGHGRITPLIKPALAAHLQQSGAAGVSASQSTLTISSFAPTADGSTAFTLTYTQRDGSGAVMPGGTAAWAASDQAVSAALSQVTATSSSILNDGIETATMTTQVLNASSNPVVGIPAANVVEASTGSGNTLTAVGAATDYLGKITTTLASTNAETKTLSATVIGQAITDTASVVVSGPPSSWTTNLPAALTLVADVNFTAGGDLNDNASTGSLANVADATAPSGDGKIVRFRYPAGSADGYGVGQRSDVLPVGTVSLYTSWNIKFSSNYRMHLTNQKLNYHWGNVGQGQPPAPVFGAALGAGESDKYAGTMRWTLGTQSLYPDFIYVNAGSHAPVRDVWYHIEQLYVMNSAVNVQDGKFKMWVDGVLQFDYSNVVYAQTGVSLAWRESGLNPYYGGSAPGDTAPETFYIDVDRWTVYSHTVRV